MQQIVRIWTEGRKIRAERSLFFLWQKRQVRKFACAKTTYQQRVVAEATKSLPPPLPFLFSGPPFDESSSPRFSSMAFKIDGRVIAQEIKVSIAEKVLQMSREVGGVPGLAVILMGNERASETYVRNVEVACKEVGINIFLSNLSKSACEQKVLQEVNRFNLDAEVHGVLVQHPLPSHIRAENVLESIHLEKDVDGLHPLNLGRLALGAIKPSFIPCTPRGCLELLFRLGINLEQKHAVVIGCSNIVGLPTALLLQRHNATVTVIHKHTLNAAEITRKADIVVSATGQAHLVRGHWLKRGAIVIDIGICVVKDSASDLGYRLVGDVCFEEAEQVASAITPVPGGVGPMTIAMLLSNTLQSARSAFGSL
ncbi:hypothetical protein O6H91_Y503100 [Diphasiastrum complanatum]|nr:hypothetical protein O6H91_Y503100 [Diphasiastrum complanatum]